MAGVNQQRIIWKFQFVYVPFEIRKVGSTAVMCSTSAADAELGWYREFQTDSSKNNGMDQSFIFKRRKSYVRCKMMRQNIEEVQEN